MQPTTIARVMAAYDLEQMLANFWVEVDMNYGRNAAEYFTEDCVAKSGTIAFNGHAGVEQYYTGRLNNIRANQKDGERTSRHITMNLGFHFTSDDEATLKFVICTFAGAGRTPVFDGTVPVAISDARFECVRGADGRWRIRGFYGTPALMGDEPFALKALTGA